MDDALALLVQGKQCCSNWRYCPQTKSWQCIPGLAHVFVRLTVYNGASGALSSLHFVDLVGSRSLSQQGPAASFNTVDTLGADSRARRLISKQLLAVNKILSGLTQKDSKQAGAHPHSQTQHKKPDYVLCASTLNLQLCLSTPRSYTGLCS